MAGSFDIFRKYQRSLLVAVAILAMLAFFVLPPFLQMGGGSGPGDPVVAQWAGGDIREGQLERDVAMRSVVNRFLVESAAAAGRDPSRLPLFPESEEAVVRTMLVAEEAKKNGLVVSDTAINDFLAQWTNNLVRQEQFGDIIAGLRLGPSGVSQHDLFEALRTELIGRNMLVMFQTGFSGDPPAWRWDYYRRLEQKATVEVVAVPVETVAAQVPAPSEAQLRGFFEQYKNDLPDPRSEAPGFREPRRVKYEYLVAKREVFEAEAAKEVTEAQIAEFYEKNKETMFRAKAPEAKTPEKEPAAEKKPAGEKPADEKPADEKPADEKPAEPKPAAPKAPVATPDKGARASASPFMPAAFKQPAAETKPAESKPVDTETSDAAKTDAAKTETTKPDDAKTEEPKPEVQCEPLESVKDKIREQLAREQANARIDAVFSAIAGDVTRYAEDYALWQARQVASAEPPKAPDIDVIAKKQGLEAGRSGLVTASQAISGGGIGQSFEFIPDPGSRFGIRQQNWLEAIFGQNTIALRPVTSRDVAGNRYLSWKTDDQPEITPTFEAIRDNVDFSWRIVEGRGIARKKAEEIAAQADAAKQSLEATVAEKTDLKVVQAGPFTWLSVGATPNSPPSVSQPEGVAMPGEEFMRAVFRLEPGQTAVAFNEPRTVCYCIRLVSLDPPASELRERFLEARSDPRRSGMVAQQEFSESFGRWIEGLEKQYGLKWSRQPRFAGR
jgi:hypothetical protein